MSNAVSPLSRSVTGKDYRMISIRDLLRGFCRGVKTEMFQKVSIEIFFPVYLFIDLLIYFKFGLVALLLRQL